MNHTSIFSSSSLLLSVKALVFQVLSLSVKGIFANKEKKRIICHAIKCFHQAVFKLIPDWRLPFFINFILLLVVLFWFFFSKAILNVVNYHRKKYKQNISRYFDIDANNVLTKVSNCRSKAVNFFVVVPNLAVLTF